MKAEIISVGTELLLGSTVNTDATDVARLLSEFGISVYWHTVVGDNPSRVREAVLRAKERSDMIITTGGLGPTCDDLTKESVAAAFSLKMVLNVEEEQRLRQRFEVRGKHMDENNLQQAWLPEGAVVLKNDWGTAPACYFNAEDTLVIMLPGPPHELRAILEHRVRPLLAEISGQVLVSHNIKFAGIGESEMEFLLRDYMNSLTNPSLAPYAKEDECYVRVTAMANSVEEAETMMKPVINKVMDTLPDYVYGIDHSCLAERVVELLIENNKTLAVAESLTGGDISKRLTDIAGASKALKGSLVVYTNEAKMKLLGVNSTTLEKHTAVSEEVAREMAENVREILGTDIGLSATGLAGPDSDGLHEVGTVFLGISTKDETIVLNGNCFFRDRATIRKRSSQYALDMVRRHLCGLKIETGDVL